VPASATLLQRKNWAQWRKSPGEWPLTARSRDADTPSLEDFPYRLSDNVRYADLDPNQHVNNAVYATYFETSRVSLVKDPANGLMPPGLGWVLVRLDIHFRHELHWPGQIELGLGIARIGRTSASFDQVVFSQGRCVASARSVTVMVDDASRKPTPLPDQVIATMQRWLMRAPQQA
jgi:acyl-CoA thioester hydrolase